MLWSHLVSFISFHLKGPTEADMLVLGTPKSPKVHMDAIAPFHKLANSGQKKSSRKYLILQKTHYILLIPDVKISKLDRQNFSYSLNLSIWFTLKSVWRVELNEENIKTCDSLYQPTLSCKHQGVTKLSQKGNSWEDSRWFTNLTPEKPGFDNE